MSLSLTDNQYDKWVPVYANIAIDTCLPDSFESALENIEKRKCHILLSISPYNNQAGVMHQYFCSSFYYCVV